MPKLTKQTDVLTDGPTLIIETMNNYKTDKKGVLILMDKVIDR